MPPTSDEQQDQPEPEPEQDRAGQGHSQPSNVATAYPTTQHGSRMTNRLLLLVPVGLTIALFLNYRYNQSQSQKLSDVESSLDGEGITNIAVCYSGHVGTFERKQVHEQNEKVFNSINSSKISYFFVVDLKDNYKDSRSGKHYTQIHEIGSLQNIFDKFKNAKVVETYSSEEHLPPSHCNDNKDYDEHEPIQDDAGHFSAAYSTLYANKKCFQLIEQYEKSNNVNFNWVIRLRPDMQISVRLPPEDATKRIHMSGFAMALIPRSFAYHYFSAVHAFDKRECENIRDMDSEVCKQYSYDQESSECLLLKWLKRNDMQPSNGLYVNRRIVYPETIDE